MRHILVLPSCLAAMNKVPTEIPLAENGALVTSGWMDTMKRKLL